jgi:endonuclease III
MPLPTSWSPDAEPYIPLQYYYRDNPWRVVVVCACLNMTSRRTVGPLLDGLFDRWPTPYAMATSDVTELSEYLRSLGMTKKRPEMLRLMSAQWWAQWGNEGTPDERDDILDLPGCGDYAADAVSIFVWGYVPPNITDHILREWVEQNDGTMDA